MSDSLVARARGAQQRVTHYFAEEIWQARIELLSPRDARRVRAARVLHNVMRALTVEDRLHVRAAALTYYTVLSLVPLLAFVFALLKGFGAYDVLIHETIRPFVLGLLAGNDALQVAFDRILGFVDATGVTSLGFVGLLTLLYAATRLLRNVEGALNELWGIEAGRDHLQQFRDYVAIIVVTPLCMMAAAALTTAGQALDLLRAAGATLGVGVLLDQLIGALGPLVALFMGLTFLYKALPFVLVSVPSAMIGAAIGSLLWYLVLIAHVRFQVGVARFNALYSGFAAVPIFLAWLQVSWLVVLIGGLIAATHQNAQGIAERMRSAGVDAARRESIGIAAMLRVARSFMACAPPLKRRDLSAALGVPDALLIELVTRLERANLVVQASAASDPVLVLARPPERIRLKQVLDALRHDREAQPTPSGEPVSAPTSDAERLWRELDHALEDTPQNRTLREVIEQTPDGPESPQAPLSSHVP